MASCMSQNPRVRLTLAKDVLGWKAGEQAANDYMEISGGGWR